MDQEKLKKILIAVITLFLFSITYYYYSTVKSTDVIKTADKSNKSDIIKPKTELKSSVNKQDKKIVVEKIIVPINKPQDKVIKPTNKLEMIRLASISAGKADPFFGINPGRSKFAVSQVSQNLSLPPVTTGGLPIISDLPTLGSVPGFKTLPDISKTAVIPEKQDYFNIKGFIGNKVIVDVNGMTDSLGTNQSLQGIKVLEVNPKSLTAKFKREKDIIIKQFRSLTKVDDPTSVKLVKNLATPSKK